MKTRNLVLTIAAASLAFGTSNLAADAEQPWHVTGAVGTVHFDQARNARENDLVVCWIRPVFRQQRQY